MGQWRPSRRQRPGQRRPSPWPRRRPCLRMTCTKTSRAPRSRVVLRTLTSDEKAARARAVEDAVRSERQERERAVEEAAGALWRKNDMPPSTPRPSGGRAKRTPAARPRRCAQEGGGGCRTEASTARGAQGGRSRRSGGGGRGTTRPARRSPGGRGARETRRRGEQRRPASPSRRDQPRRARWQDQALGGPRRHRRRAARPQPCVAAPPARAREAPCARGDARRRAQARCARGRGTRGDHGARACEPHGRARRRGRKAPDGDGYES